MNLSIEIIKSSYSKALLLSVFFLSSYYYILLLLLKIFINKILKIDALIL